MSILLTDGRWKIDAAPQGARMDLAHGPSSIQAIDPARHPSLAGREDVKRAMSHEASACLDILHNSKCRLTMQT